MRRAIAEAGFFFAMSAVGWGAGASFKMAEPFPAQPYPAAFEAAKKAAEAMVEACRQVNPYNFPGMVALGTSEKRGVVTLVYDFDPAAGSICSPPPPPAKVLGKAFVPHFGARFYLHVRIVREGAVARGVTIEVVQQRGVRKAEFAAEMEALARTYLRFLRERWPR